MKSYFSLAIAVIMAFTIFCNPTWGSIAFASAEESIDIQSSESEENPSKDTDGYDNTAPIINSISIDKTTVNAPGTFSLTLDITEEDTGVKSIGVAFMDKTGEPHSETYEISSNQDYYDLSSPVFSGKFTMSFTVSSRYLADTIQIGEIQIADEQGNKRDYWNGWQNLFEGDTAYIADIKDSSIKCYINNGNNIDVTFDTDRDTIAPIINSIEIDKTSLKAPGTFSLTLDITEEDTGVKSIGVAFMDKTGEPHSETYEISSNQDYYDLSSPVFSGKFKMYFTVSSRYLADTIQIGEIQIVDEQGNKRDYWNGWQNLFEEDTAYIADIKDSSIKCYINNGNNIDVTFDEGKDTVAPVIRSITFNKTTLTKPGTFSVTFDIIEDGSGVRSIGVAFMDKNGEPHMESYEIESDQNYIDLSKPVYNGKYTMKFSVSSKYQADAIQIGEIQIYDRQGNKRDYWNGWQNLFEGDTAYIADIKDVSCRCYINNENNIDVFPEFNVNFQSYITNTNIVDRLVSMPEGQTAMINYDNNNYIANAGLFNAIKGKDKTIVFSNNAYQWIFNGNNVINGAKNINLRFTIGTADVRDYGSSEKAVSVIFANNGVLPGKAEVRMKSDYLYNKGHQGSLTLYYLSGTTLIKEANPNFDLVIDGTDKWCHFDITHNSKFFVSSIQLNKYKSPFTSLTKVSKGKKAFTAKWKKKTCSGYQIRYSVNSNMKNSKTVTIKKYKKTSQKIKKLKKNKKYYVQIRTYRTVAGKKYFSAWSTKKSVKTR